MSESKVAGMWRILKDFPSDYPKKSGTYVCKSLGTVILSEWNGRFWIGEKIVTEWLDESPEAQSLARQEDKINLQDTLLDMRSKEIDNLTAQLAAVKEQRDLAIEIADDLGHWGTYASEYFQQKHGYEKDLDRLKKLIDEIKAIEGEKT